MSERIEEERLLQSLEGFEKLIATADATTFISASRKIRYRDILRETRNKIKSLYARVEALEAAKSWISVKDRLPKDRQEVLVLSNIEEYDIVIFDEHAKKWWGNEGWYSHEMIAYWMPLPEPPKEEE